MRCIACGRELPAKGGPGRSLSYCSAACRQAGYRATKRVADAAHGTLAPDALAAIKNAVRGGMAVITGRAAQLDPAAELGQYGSLARLEAADKAESRQLPAGPTQDDRRDAFGRRVVDDQDDRDAAAKSDAPRRDGLGRVRKG